jgi:spore maturation protein CgeB
MSSPDGPLRPRICMPTFSSFARNAFRAGSYEAQDVLVGCDDVELIPLARRRGLATRSKLLRDLVRYDVSRKLASLNPGLAPVRLTREYDLFLFACSWWSDLWYANAVRGWRDQCRSSVCWIDELWLRDARRLEYWLPALAGFDHVIVGTNGTAKPLGDILGRECHELPGGVDTVRFSPYPKLPDRVVDLYSIGRVVKPIHQRVTQYAREHNFFYIHDTLENFANCHTLDHRQHRDLYANIAKRCRFFCVAPGRMDSPDETQGQVSFGYRFFEGSAAGAVLIGQAPHNEAFRSYFDWPQAVIEVAADGSDVMEVIADLRARPQQLQDISRRNAITALRRHDWVYRWKEVLRIAGLAPQEGMLARERRLAELATLAEGMPAR